MNLIILIGRLAADPELKTTQGGMSVCTFRIAVDRRFGGADGQRQADFLTCVAWRQTADFVARHFTKGKQIGVKGSLQTRTYEDRDGNRRTAYEVVCEQVEFVGPREDKPAQPVPATQRPPQQTKLSTEYGELEEITSDEDLPF